MTNPAVMPGKLSSHLPIFLVTALVGTLYLLTMPRLITLEDAGIFQMVCHLGGISHPPGYPLFTGLCQLLTFGNGTWSGNLMSVYFALAAVATLYYVVLELTDDSLVALLAAAAYGVTRCLWSQAIIIEVYSLAAFQFLFCWWLLLRFVKTEKTNYWYALCFCAGLSLTNHWPLFVLSSLGFVGLLAYHLQTFLRLLTPRIVFLSLCLLLLGLTPYLYLFQDRPDIAMYGPVGDWNFVPYVLREYYNDDFVGARITDKLQYLAWLIPLTAQQLSWFALPLVVVGLWFSPKKLGKANLLSIALIFFGSTVLLVMLLNFRFEPQVLGVFLPYPIIAMAAYAVVFAIGAGWLIRRLGKVRQGYGIAASLVLFAAIVADNYFEVDRSNSRIADEYGRVVLQTLPADALLLVAGDNQIGPIGFLNRVGGVRPDVTVQSVDGLLFADNLLKRRISEEERIETLREFKQQTGRRIFSVQLLTNSDTDYGFYYEFEGDKHQVLLPEIERFMDYILDLHLSGLIKDSHERVLVHSLLVSLARQYSGHALLLGTEQMSEERVRRLQRLQQTLPGKMSALRILTAQNPGADGLLEFAFAVEDQLDESIAKQHDALVYEFIARILLARGDQAAAAAYFQKSLVSFPTGANASLCEYVAVSTPQQQQELLTALKLNSSNCLKGAG
ncbi:MAG: protein O-mannosyl-transferase family [Pseudomonadales bacterium]